MSPPFSQHPCSGCFLQEQRGGRVCPAAREVHALDDLEVKRGEMLRAAIVADAQAVVSFAELLRRDAAQGRLPHVLAGGAASALLLPPVGGPMRTHSGKELVHVHVPGTAR